MLKEYLHTAKMLRRPGEVSELRIMGLRGRNPAYEGSAGGKAGIVSGYYDDDEKLAAAVATIEKLKPKGIYMTINPCMDVLLSRAANRLICPQEENTTPDIYTKCIRWFPVDLDAPLLDGKKRPKGVSASDAEIAVCKETAEKVAAWLENEMGFAKAIRGFSGNGLHLLYRLPDLPNDDAHKLLIKNAMAALAKKFGTDTIDVTVVNPARIWKYYGTTGRKGDSTPDRPHRKSYLFKGQPETLDGIPVTPLAILEKLAALAHPSGSSPSGGSAPGLPVPVTGQPGQGGSSTPPNAGQTRPMKKSDLGPLDMERYLAHYGISFDVKATGDATLYRLDKCLFNPDHGKGEASIVVPQKGAIKYQCFHSSCAGKKWKDAKQVISGDKKLAEFCTGYDPNWKPLAQTGTGAFAELPDDPIDMMNRWRQGLNAKLPSPKEVDPTEFYEKHGKRPTYVPGLMARYFVNYHFPICHSAGIFYQYENGEWKELSEGKIGQCIIWALKNKIQAGWIGDQLKIIAKMVNREMSEWPNDIMLINVKNGMINLNTGELIPHDPVYGSRSQLPVNYKQQAHSPRWQQFLKDIFPDDKNDGKKFLLQQYFGYCLLRDCRYQKALFMYGTGSNGKDTVLNVLQAMLGEENVSNMTLSDLSKPFKPSYLLGKLVNLGTETNAREPTAMDMFKAIVGGGRITTERKHGQPFSYRPYCKFISAMNDAPSIPDKSYGLTRRIIVLNFNRRLEPHEIVPNMEALLIEEIDGIFNWAIEGLRSLMVQRGFRIAEEVEEETAQMISTLNPLLIFARECLKMGEGGQYDPKLICYTNDLWNSYKGWCNEGKNRPLGRNKFYDQMMMSYYGKIKKTQETGTGKQIFRGIELNEEGEEYASRAKRRAEKYGE